MITQSLFKTAGAGDGFRRFRVGDRGQIGVVHVDDLSAIQPFEGATNRTAILTCTRGETKYPVPYSRWKRRARAEPVRQEDSITVVRTKLRIDAEDAFPVNRAKATSPWLTCRKGLVQTLSTALGRSDYAGRAHAGSCTWLNGVFWVQVLSVMPSGELVIENQSDIGKKKVRQRRATVEPDLVFPLIRGRDVTPFSTTPTLAIILPQDPSTRAPIPLGAMKKKYPKTFSFPATFEADLRGRSGFKRYYDSSDPFYAIYNVGPYTVADFKVAWPEVGNTVQAAAVLPAPLPGHRVAPKPIVPDHTCIAIATDSRTEAYYLAALLNSSVARQVVESYIVLHPSPHILDHVRIPLFDPKSSLHKTIAELGKRAAQHAQRDEAEGLGTAMKEIDEAAEEMWATLKSK
ncbi:MAG: hypothetical protein HY699_10810 [Deltaproteobacteria bacterium]|nr:hypothetical protein [Deltaproteobacteria bacterium]